MFEFGSIISLDYKVTFYCFLAVVFFVILFEYCTEIMEYFLHESLYSQMIQIIYKELMLMGLVTFCIIVFVASNKADSYKHAVYIKGIDFSHVFLFFVTLFFVMQGFYLIIISMLTTKEYHKNLTEKTFELIVKLEKVSKSYIKSLLYRYHIYPISSIRHRVEFSLIHSIFIKTYILPKDFDFPQYLSGCFDRFALKTIKRSLFSWMMLIFVIGMNCVRIGWGFTCKYKKPSDSYPSSYTASSSSSQENLFRILLDATINESPQHSTDPNVCRTAHFKLFILVGILLIIYTFCINVVALMYKSR
jgi:hypothetical protein